METKGGQKEEKRIKQGGKVKQKRQGSWKAKK